MTGTGPWRGEALLGAVLVGGAGRRYGRPKAPVFLAGKPMVRWTLDAMEPRFPHRGTVGSEALRGRAYGVPGRPDRMPGLGPIGGLITALEWAREIPLGGVFLLGCDMPLVDSGLIGRILDYRGRSGQARVPASGGPLGLEPLCAAYTLDCLAPALELARSGRRSMMALLGGLDVEILPPDALGDPDEVTVAFTNVNTVEEGRRVEAILGRDRGGGGLREHAAGGMG